MRPTREQDLVVLLSLIRLVNGDLRAAADRLHEETGTTASDRVQLKLLIDLGPMTVPDLAREQGVTRQHVQVVCDGLHGKGLIEWLDNPAHKRSRLAAITNAGYKLIDQARMRESRWMLDLAGTFSASGLEEARRTLEALRRRL
ncbi:MAG: MarR family transcriptional regulator [Notoacmeibacter sp.]|nr:MarR family transcriptional regulator [Notoacmeibacter sp.]